MLRMILLRITRDDVQKPFGLVWLLKMIPASYRCCPQLLHPHVEDDNVHAEDEHPLHPLQGISPLNKQCNININMFGNRAYGNLKLIIKKSGARAQNAITQK
jgi:hypothetical protein